METRQQRRERQRKEAKLLDLGPKSAATGKRERFSDALESGHSNQLQHQSEAVGVYSAGLGNPKWKSWMR